jgi:hypothetical protein
LLLGGQDGVEEDAAEHEWTLRIWVLLTAPLMKPMESLGAGSGLRFERDFRELCGLSPVD